MLNYQRVPKWLALWLLAPLIPRAIIHYTTQPAEGDHVLGGVLRGSQLVFVPSNLYQSRGEPRQMLQMLQLG